LPAANRQRVPSGVSPKEKQGINDPNLISAREGFGFSFWKKTGEWQKNTIHAAA